MCDVLVPSAFTNDHIETLYNNLEHEMHEKAVILYVIDSRAARLTVSAYGRIKYGRSRCRPTGTRTVRQ